VQARPGGSTPADGLGMVVVSPQPYHCHAQDEEGEDLPALEETVDEGSRMEEVRRAPAGARAQLWAQ